MNLIVRPEAETDLLLAYKWYEDEREQLGLEFMASVGLQLEKVASSPESYPVVYKGVRRCILKRFPYAIFYLAREDAVVVICVSHQARNPDHWKSRSLGH